MEPTTLLEAVSFFSDPTNCREYMVPKRWANGVVTCPTCGTEKVKFQPQHNRWQCSVHHPKRQFTLKTGTIMEDSPIGLDKWLPAIWLICSNRNGISSWELHRALGVTQKTAWFLLNRIRLAMQDDLTGGMLSGEVEIDETLIGGKARNMHRSRRIKAKVQGRAREKPLSLECSNARPKGRKNAFALRSLRIVRKQPCGPRLTRPLKPERRYTRTNLLAPGHGRNLCSSGR